ncbi:unnamed protein product [Ambrosiozyma monospora]|uniref:Unnamed protein product n=1 Tax=Ambrosiozyma monospora TaxID=43982 RepID=A0ACB5SUI4_AMBMO|nr:unnamed protein product [Ambrosiozyma monospora]
MNITPYDILKQGPENHADMISFESNNRSLNSETYSEGDYIFSEMQTNDEDKEKLQNYKLLEPNVLAKTRLQRFKDNIWYDDRTWTRIFIISSIISSLLILALESVLTALAVRLFIKLPQSAAVNDEFKKLTNFAIDWFNNSVMSYMGIYIFAELYQVLLALIVLYVKDNSHLLLYLFMLIVMSVYSGLEHMVVVQGIHIVVTTISYYGNTGDTPVVDSYSNEFIVKVLGYVASGLFSLFFLVQSYFGFKLFPRFKKATGERVGNNLTLIKRNMVFEMHRALLILLSFFVPGMFLASALCYASSPIVKGLCYAGMVLSLLGFISADFCSSREKKGWTIAFMVAYVILIGIIGVMSAFYITIEPPYHLITNVVPYSVETMNTQVVYISASVLGICGGLLLIVQFFLSIKLILNFNKGLKDIHGPDHNWAKFIFGISEIQRSESDI